MIEKTPAPQNHKSQIPNRKSLDLTALVPTYNEEANIQECLESLAFADEILVVDSFSTDRTVSLAAQNPRVRVLQHAYEGNGPQCNWGMDRASHPWIFILDADERVTPELGQEIGRLLESEPPASLYRIRRINFFLGRRIRGSGWGRDRLVRLLKRGAARYPERKVHADIEAPPGTPTLAASILHHTYRSLDQYVEKLDRYARWGAEDLAREGRRSGFGEVALRPLWRFLRSYFFEAGFRDGVRGLLVCGLQAYGVFLKWARLWEMQRRKDEGRRT